MDKSRHLQQDPIVEVSSSGATFHRRQTSGVVSEEVTQHLNSDENIFAFSVYKNWPFCKGKMAAIVNSSLAKYKRERGEEEYRNIFIYAASFSGA
ncbi:hypothetical protein JTE90_019866 [Oedothorax gibbosus]|uniref:Uncharacterized protein n=1 Tax=Oedothorax gibbosus TaxID=931172 RepID=A0AAV6VZF6_9ARAC|nr:hypothetical protein JTE90_019866 [Oedothorax gibbosus]